MTRKHRKFGDENPSRIHSVTNANARKKLVTRSKILDALRTIKDNGEVELHDVPRNKLREIAGLSDTSLETHLREIGYHVSDYVFIEEKWIPVIRACRGVSKPRPARNVRPQVSGPVLEPGQQLADFWMRRKAA